MDGAANRLLMDDDVIVPNEENKQDETASKSSK
jgi:hypothetical protein